MSAFLHTIFWSRGHIGFTAHLDEGVSLYTINLGGYSPNKYWKKVLLFLQKLFCFRYYLQGAKVSFFMSDILDYKHPTWDKLFRKKFILFKFYIDYPVQCSMFHYYERCIPILGYLSKTGQYSTPGNPTNLRPVEPGHHLLPQFVHPASSRSFFLSLVGMVVLIPASSLATFPLHPWAVLPCLPCSLAHRQSSGIWVFHSLAFQHSLLVPSSFGIAQLSETVLSYFFRNAHHKIHNLPYQTISLNIFGIIMLPFNS